MSNTRITRELQVKESVNKYAKDGLIARGYPQDDWEFVESYPYGLVKLDKNIVAAGFTFDDGGKNFELGSNLKERKYTIEFFVFGQTLTYAESLANAIKFTLEQDFTIPLLDITVAPPTQVDVMYVDQVHARRQPLPDPEPASEFVYYVFVEVTDYYLPAST